MKRREPGPLLLSIVIHVAVGFAILNAAFHYDFSRLSSTPRAVTPAERLTYMTLPGAGGVTGGKDSTAKPARATTPAQGFAPPAEVPVTLPPPAPVPSSAAGGVEGGRGRASAITAITGVVPADPDPRLASDPRVFYPAPKTHAERVDSAVRASIYAYNDSIARAMARAGKQPGDWTFEKNGEKWGIDGNKIYLGKYAIPSAVLAALPIHIQGNPGESINDRLVNTRRSDILIHADAAFHDDEFKSAVKRIRERKDRERKEKQQGGDVPDKPIPVNPDIAP